MKNIIYSVIATIASIAKQSDRSLHHRFGKTILLFLLFLLIPALPVFAQFSDSLDVTIDVSSDSSNSSQADMTHKKLLSITFPSAMTSDTVFVQHRRTTTGAWTDAYFTDNSMSKVRVHIVVETGATVSIHPVMAYFLRRYIRLVSDDPEAADRLFGIDRGNY